MANEIEYVNFKDFVDSLPAADDFAAGDKSVLSGATLRKMDKDVQLQKTAENTFGSIHPLCAPGQMIESDVTSFNDLPLNTVIQIGKDLSDSPSPGSASWGVAFTHSSFNGNQIVQDFVEASVNPFYNGRCYRRLKRAGVWTAWQETPNLSQLSLSRSFAGADSDTLYDLVPVMAGGILVINVSDPNWADSNGPANKFVVSGIKSDGSFVDLALFTRGSDVGKNVISRIPTDVFAVRIMVRANVGTTVLMQYKILSNMDVMELVNQTITRRDQFELGNITIKPASVTYSSSTSRLRTAQNFAVKLSKYDVICCRDGYEIYVGASADGLPTFDTKGWVSEYTATSDVLAHFVLRRKTEATFTFEEASKAFFILSYDSNIVGRSVIEQAQILNTYWRFKIDGNNNTVIVKRFYPLPGQKITIVADKTNWSISNLTPSGSSWLFGVRYVKSDESTTDIIGYLSKFKTIINPTTVTVPSDAVALEILCRADVGETVTLDIYGTSDAHEFWEVRSFVRGINHRGFSDVAPENTLPAFRLSKINGFSAVETDVRRTSDGVLVCIHDDTVDRTSDGNGYVSSFTYEQLQELDFGSWKSPVYAGTKIPSFEEFVAACRTMGLEMFVELKENGLVDDVMAIIDLYKMRKKTVIISTGLSRLQEVAANYPDVSVGLLITNGDVDASAVANALSLKTDKNETAIMPNKSHLTDAGIALCKASALPLIVWGEYYGFDTMRQADPYISGFIHNSLNAEHLLAAQEMCR